MIIPAFVTTITSSSPSTARVVTSFPVLSVILIVVTPFAPLWVKRYSSKGVFFPYPCSVILRIYLPSNDVLSPTALSFSSNEIPLTPAAVLPITLTSCSLNLTILPLSAEIQINVLPSVNLTSSNSSFSFIVIAYLPVWRIKANSFSDVRFTIPSFVAKKTKCSSSYPEQEMIDITFSLSSKFNKLTTGVPLLDLANSGIWYPLKRYTLPRFVKNNKSICVLA